ncbi:MAG: F0F1 ATP synthase subunit epsilon [Rickettsiales bacterium]|jgi:alternate F1F0 ATPase F1 subunit epsilon|nr:F0F1 ATP synthase subunit epsilon [Rickettsiales bacterium]
MIELEIITPASITRVPNVSAVYAEGADGPFTVLPRHADYAACLVPSVFSYKSGGKEVFFGLDEGVLTKVASKVAVSTRRAIAGTSLSDLKRRVAEEFRHEGEEEKKTRGALAALEGNIAKLFVELKNG